MRVKPFVSPKAPPGWLTQLKKRERRDSPLPINEKQVGALIAYILTGSHTKLDGYMGRFVRLRDAAMTAMFWLFGKRCGEVARLKTEDVWIEGDELKVKFTIEKKAKTYKVCECKTRNARDAVFCKRCGKELGQAKVAKKGAPIIRVKRKKLSNPFVRYILDYMDLRKRFPPGYFFPPLNTQGKAHNKALDGIAPVVNKPLHRSVIFRIYDRYLLSPHLFRYAFAKNTLRRTKDVMLVKEAGDWSKVDTLLEYAKSLGVTREDEEFAKL